VLAPGRDPDLYARRKDEMFASIDVVQRLWAGESVTMARPDGTAVPVRTLPRPLQPRLPVWITSQGSVETFVRAGEIGANVLCGLIGHRLGDLEHRIDAYRTARSSHGFAAGAGRVSVMLHTFLGPDDDDVRALVRQPLMRYLRTFLTQDPAENRFTAGDEVEREAALAATFEHYFDHAGLLGTPDKCEALVEDLVDAGVDEVACLVDFGLPGDVVKDGLHHLSELKDRYRR
jgi:natural product biosynthesis luciferase-like monooxygenase protein